MDIEVSIPLIICLDRKEFSTALEYRTRAPYRPSAVQYLLLFSTR